MTRRTRTALIGAAIGAALLALTWVVALHVGRVERLDQSIFNGFYGFRSRRHVDTVAQFIAELCNPRPYVYLAAVPVLIALVRRRPRLMLGIGAILLGANLTTQLLKQLLAEPRAHALLVTHSPINPASWPSGHATAAMSLALCCVLAAPARLRPAVAAAGAAFAVAVSYSFLTLGWHYPSDVFGGFLVAWTWTALVVAAISAADARWPRQAGGERRERLSILDALAPQAALVVGTLLVAGLVALARPHAVVAYARVHGAFMVGAAAIGVLALVLASAITLTTRR
jgi:membrane-associated phospholipid phosphatase